MGTLFRIVLYAPDEETAKKAAGAAFTRIAQLDQCMSDYKPDSELIQFCEKAGGEPVHLSDDLFDILTKSQEISRASNGAFDVTVGPLVRLWRLSRRKRELPPEDILAKNKAVVGYEKLILDPTTHTGRLTQKGMILDLGGIGKGYAVAKALGVLKEHGISSALVVGGGEVGVSAPPPGLEGWTVGIAPLEDPSKAPSVYLLLHDASVSTSGDAEQYVEIGGVRYSHHIDPRTGLGLTVHSSVSVVAPAGVLADGLTTAACILGPEAGMKFLEDIPGIAALFVVGTKDGQKAIESRRWKDVPKTGPKKESAEAKTP